MRIGTLAERTGASQRSLRYYEQTGLLDSTRSESGQRHYSEDAVARVALIRDLLAAGLGTTAIAEVLPCVSNPSTQSSELTKRLIRERDRIDADIDRLVRTREALDGLISEAPPLA